MGFLFGMVSMTGRNIEATQLAELADKVKWPGFNVVKESFGSFGIGYCHHTNRSSGISIFRNSDLTVICDARVYNAGELKSSLSFSTTAELFALAYNKWGEVFPDHFNGDFAAVIIDEKKQHVIMVRDHIGVRPLCYTVTGETLVFASHEFGIAASGCIEPKLCEKVFLSEQFLFHVNTPYEQTSFEGIKKCVPGFTTLVSRQDVRKIQYWFPENIKTNKNLTMSQSVSMLREALDKATLRRMGNVNMGTHVSGGLDSCGIAAMVARHLPDASALQGYSWSPDQLAHDPDIKHEKLLIDEFVKEIGIPLQYIPTAEENLLSRMETPEFERMEVEEATMRLAEKDGIEFMFSGYGGDEFLSFATRGAVNHIVFKGHFWDFARFVKKYGIRMAVAMLKAEVLPVFQRKYSIGANVREKYLPLFKSAVYGTEYELMRQNGQDFYFAQRDLRKFINWQIYHYHLPQRMDSWAYYGEKYGIEYKFPLLDKHLLEHHLSIPVAFFYKNWEPRYLFKEIMRGILPDVIRKRKDKENYLFQKYILDKKERLFNHLHTHLQYFEDFEGNRLMDIPKLQELVDSKPSDLLDTVNRTLILEIFIRYREMHRRYVDAKKRSVVHESAAV